MKQGAIENSAENMRMQPLVSIIISNVNGKEVLRECLLSISMLEYTNYETIVVDAGSTDGSREMLSAEFPWVALIKVERKGLGECNNIGVQYSHGDLLVVDLNNDDVVDKKWLSHLVNFFLNNDHVGAVCGARIVYGSANIIDSAGGKIDYLTGQTPAIGANKNASVLPNEPYFVDYLPVILTSRKIFDTVGGFDENYYIYFEDTDLSLQISKLLKLAVAPQAIFYHKGSSTIGKASSRSYYFLKRNRIRFIIKNFNSINLLTALAYEFFVMNLIDALLSFFFFNKTMMKIFPSKKTYIGRMGHNWIIITQIKATFWNLLNIRTTILSRYMANEKHRLRSRM
jgi:GT2 family glycosyltransferase